MKTGIELIAIERQEQMEKHGKTIESDRISNCACELNLAAQMLLAEETEEGIDPESYPYGWDKDICVKMLSKPYKERLIIAGALIAAEIDRIAEPAEQEPSTNEWVTPKTWEEFRGHGLLFLVNQLLHVFGWAICLNIEDNKVLDVYPARVKFRGFSEDGQSDAHIKLANYLADNASELKKEAEL